LPFLLRSLFLGYKGRSSCLPRRLQTLDLYHVYFVLELWCWMAQIGNEQPLEKLAFDLERASVV
jgi:hypothetical protein